VPLIANLHARDTPLLIALYCRYQKLLFTRVRPPHVTCIVINRRIYLFTYYRLATGSRTGVKETALHSTNASDWVKVKRTCHANFVPGSCIIIILR